MTVYETLQKRRSIRRFTNAPVEAEKIDLLLHAAMSGPSACNCRPWDFYVVTSPEHLEKLRSVTQYTNMNAPLAIVVCGNLSRTMPEPLSAFWVQDCSAATENILLEAVELGLGSVWCGIHPNREAEQRLSAVLELPEDRIPLDILYIGYPAEEAPARDQYEESCVHFVR